MERVALRCLLPPRGHRLIDIGGGYGRLAPLYGGYEEVVFFDYALSQLRQGQELWGDTGPDGRPRYLYVAGDFYNPPFSADLFETVTMVRTLHHAADAPAALRGVSDILAPGGSFVLEFANKRNVKAILRYALRRQDWSPFDREPVEFVKLNFDFHPAWVREQLADAGLRPRQQRAVSYFRLAFLKRSVPTRLLVALDRLLQPLGGLLPITPSTFVRCEAEGDRPAGAPDMRFRCTICGSSALLDEGITLNCEQCGARFAVREGIYDFRRRLGGAQDG